MYNVNRELTTPFSTLVCCVLNEFSLSLVLNESLSLSTEVYQSRYECAIFLCESIYAHRASPSTDPGV